MSVDGTDFKIQEPSPFSPSWFSHKFKGPGLRYEIGLNIRTGDIVWANGPFPCGTYPDRKIARDKGLEKSLDEGEKYVADGGYRGGTKSVTPNGLNNNEQRMQQLVRSRHETVNARFKHFGALERVFRHKPHKHGVVFGAIVNITQICICEESRLFQIDYIE